MRGDGWDMKDLKKIVGIGIISILTGSCLCGCPVYSAGSHTDATASSTQIIALDPGHGGDESGAYYYGIREKDANYRIAELMQEELQAYQGVKTVILRNGDEQLDLATRAQRAKQEGAGLLVSLHLNASTTHASHGASVYISTGTANKESLRQLADCFLGQLEHIGLTNAGTFARVTQMGGKRADGSYEDYYGILRYAYQNGIPAVIVEHCYMDAQEDRSYVSTEEGLRKLAKADADAIADYYGWVKEDGTKPIERHAKVYGATTAGIAADWFQAPQICNLILESYDGTSPAYASYKVDVEDRIGITSVYMVYQSVADGSTFTVPLEFAGTLTTGTHECHAYIPENLHNGNYRLLYIGAYDSAGYDAGYNRQGNSMEGYGKCEELNTFSYDGAADFTVQKKGSIATAHARRIDYQIQMGMRNRHNIYPQSMYPY